MISSSRALLGLRAYLSEFFEASLLLSLFTSLVGIALASDRGSIDIGHATLATIGAVLAQASVNLVNDYHDCRSGIDLETVKTPFSGGSGLVASGKVSTRGVLSLGLTSAVVAALIGAYLSVVVSPVLFLLAAFGGLAVFLYTPLIVRIPMVAEPFVMLSFFFVGVGGYIAALGSLKGLGTVVWVLLPAGMLAGIALLVNEVPDAPVDARHGRKHAVIQLENPGRLSIYFLALEVLTYAFLAIGVFGEGLPLRFFLPLVTLPFVFMVTIGIRKYSDPLHYERVMAINSMSTVLYLALLLGAAVL
jgi:1,4-dihydroxy-2-naphthoate octaprenyltransferase